MIDNKPKKYFIYLVTFFEIQMFFYYILTVSRKMMRQNALIKTTHQRILVNQRQIRYLTQQNALLEQQQSKNIAEMERLQKLNQSYVWIYFFIKKSYFLEMFHFFLR